MKSLILIFCLVGSYAAMADSVLLVCGEGNNVKEAAADFNSQLSREEVPEGSLEHDESGAEHENDKGTDLVIYKENGMTYTCALITDT